ncbi:MAG: HlyD family efflux transporter periplasmic adaptor subunit [Planctomycetota bacterium]|nr:HlyD family efflux transporter periplasmic adaptor subunit [Planctomycetota bacterium]
MDAEEPAPALLRRTLTSVVLIALVLGAAGMGFTALASMRKESTRAQDGPLAPLVRVAVAQRTEYTETVRGFGRARPLRAATVAAEVVGLIVSVDPALEAGQIVEGAKGTASALPILVTIDDRDLVDRLERAKAEAEAAEAEITRLASQKGSLRERLSVTVEELEAAERELARIAPLVPKTLSLSDLDMQKIQVNLRQRARLLLQAEAQDNADAARMAEARLRALQRGVALAEREQGRAQVAAPFAGRIEARYVEVGERVKVGDPLFDIVDLSRIEIPVSLAAGRYEDVVAGARVVLRLPEHDEPLWEGTVERVSPSIDGERRTFFAYIEVPGTPGANRAPPGTHLVAEVQGRTHRDVVAVPRRAFLGDRIFVAKPGTREGEAVVEVRRPTLVRMLPGVALVREGLADGEHYLLTNLESVAEGSIVRIEPEAR